MAIRSRRTAYVGSDAGVEPWIGASTKVVDLEGRMVVPGFIDAHIHPLTGGVELERCDLNGALAAYREPRHVACSRCA